MDIQSEFNSLYEMLKQSRNHLFAQEIIHEIENSEVLFQSKAVLETSHAYNVYKDRFEIQSQITGKKTVEGYETLIINLNQEIGIEIYIYGITTVEATFMIFVSSNNKIIGILKSIVSDIVKKQQVQKLYIDKGLEKNNNLFYKKKLNRE